LSPGFSRKTGYKIFDRYREHGLEALNDRSRRPVGYANLLPQQVAALIVRLKTEKPRSDERVRRLPNEWSTTASAFRSSF
jgi:hypothetical protein